MPNELYKTWYDHDRNMVINYMIQNSFQKGKQTVLICQDIFLRLL